MTLFIVILVFMVMALAICYLASAGKKETALQVKPKEELPAIPPEPIITPPPQAPAPPQEPIPPQPSPPPPPPPPEGPGF